MNNLNGVHTCDGCGAFCNKSVAGTPRPARGDGLSDVASYFETAPRFAKLHDDKLGLVWCCECHRMSNYCQHGEHELAPELPRFDGRLILTTPERPAPRCLAELAGERCELSEKHIAHGHAK
jgi:hypothetical protein